MSGWSRIALTVPRVPCTMFSTPLHIQPTLLMSGWSRIALTVPRVPCTMFSTPLHISRLHHEIHPCLYTHVYWQCLAISTPHHTSQPAVLCRQPQGG